MNRFEKHESNDDHFEAEVNMQELDIELKPNENLFMVTVEFTEGSEILMTKSRDMAPLQRILQYNRISYSVDIVV